MVVIGPGLSLDGETQQLVRELVRTIKKPVLIDGDGITAIADQLEMIRERKGKTILTPHAGEMSRIAKKSVDEINRQRIDIREGSTDTFRDTNEGPVVV
jgi:NAD(P)H-hydrate repair Nnr-like enzyme with NAD(P)H-hydrate dehydratase domain